RLSRFFFLPSTRGDRSEDRSEGIDCSSGPLSSPSSFCRLTYTSLPRFDDVLRSSLRGSTVSCLSS
ncbi:hypothetical protein PFISCL1PPCAC_24492, partial [Pristionchus fissidentatus]